MADLQFIEGGYDAVCETCQQPYTFNNARGSGAIGWRLYCSVTCEWNAKTAPDQARSAFEKWKLRGDVKQWLAGHIRVALRIWTDAYREGFLAGKAERPEGCTPALICAADKHADDYEGQAIPAQDVRASRDGQNMLGKLWMEIRAELRAAAVSVGPTGGGDAP